jgi:phosphoribosylaminoimidazolecarboxamide formyltransferase / IMP cyclohydrolase
MPNKQQSLKVRRALFTVYDKEGILELAKAFHEAGTTLVGTGRTAKVLQDGGFEVTPIEYLSGSPEAFRGRMKTLSFPICSGILYRRGDARDEQDLKQLNIQPIDCVVVNFYPFEKSASKSGVLPADLIEEVDIGGPTLVRAAAKNSPDVLVLTSPDQYPKIIQELKETGSISIQTVESCAGAAWERVLSYDAAIARELGGRKKKPLRYGENPHQKGLLEIDPEGPIAWEDSLTSVELSYNNILDVSAAYSLASDMIKIAPDSTGVVIVKHNNPCGAAIVPKSQPNAQKLALMKAWEGDPVSAFGGVLIFTDPIEEEVANWLNQNFIELVAAPGLTLEAMKSQSGLKNLLAKRKNLKAVEIRRFHEVPAESMVVVPGGRLFQSTDLEIEENLKSVTKKRWPKEKSNLARFGIVVCRALKSNAVAIVREMNTVPGGMQLIGTGQGQPNRVDALTSLALPRAQKVLSESVGALRECVLVSDGFFPFRDTVDAAYAAGIRWIVQPGGSLKDSESIEACDEHDMAMAFSGVRHFRH